VKPDPSLIISIVGMFAVWTVSVATLVWWLSDQFRKTRHMLSGAMDMRFSILDEKMDEKFGDHETRIRTLERRCL